MSLDPESRDRLVAWMDQEGLPGAGEPLDIDEIAGGASNEILGLRRGGAHLVLRRPPPENPEGRDRAMLREYRVLSALAGTEVPHPRVRGACEDPSVLGTFFYVMDHVDGWSGLEMVDPPPPFDTDLAARRELAFELVDGIARLGNVDWQARGLEGFGKPDGFHERQVDRWLAHLDQFRFRDLPGLDVAAEWLRRHRPSRYQPGILHGDYQFANVMFRHGAPARLAAIVDWEMATVGDPLLDLGWVAMSWPVEGEEHRASGYVDFTGLPTRDEILSRYQDVSGRPVDEIDYYLILARFKMAVVLEGGYARWVAGDATNPRIEAFGDVVLDMAAKAADLAESTSL